MTRCSSKSRFGRCGLDTGHESAMHAVPIGDGVWFGYRSGRGRQATRVGYGKFDAAGSFRLLDNAPTT